MTDFGGMGGISGGREVNNEDLFEATIKRVFGEQMKTDDDLCKDIWSALANVDWYNFSTHDSASYSFRAAGDLIAAVRGSGDYIDWYCSGPDASVSDFIRRSMKKEGWIYDDTAMICDEPGCLDDVSCGWPSDKGYRSTCYKHYDRATKDVSN